MYRNSLDLKNPRVHASLYDYCLATERDPASERQCTSAAPPTVGKVAISSVIFM